MSLGQGHHPGLLPERQAVQAWFVMWPEENREIRSAAAQVAEEMRSIALDHGEIDTSMSPDKPKQGIAKPTERSREICPNNKLTDEA
jgi:hypothetical protein